MREVVAYRAEMRATLGTDGSRSLTGLIPYNSRSADLGNFVEVIAPGAFADALKPGADVLCLRDHDEKILLGRTKSKTLDLADSPQGLRYNVALPKTNDAADLSESVSRKDIDSCSFGFVCPKGGDSWDMQGGVAVRTLHKVNLFEISPCSFAAYPASSVALRSCPPEIRHRLHATARSLDTANRVATLNDVLAVPTLTKRRSAAEPLESWRNRMHLEIELRKRRFSQAA